MNALIGPCTSTTQRCEAISAASPSITPQYARDNAARLDELDQAICDLVA